MICSAIAPSFIPVELKKTAFFFSEKKDLIKKGDDIIMFSRGGCERYYRVGIDGKLCGSDGIILDKGKRNLDIWGMRDVESVLERLQLSKFI